MDLVTNNIILIFVLHIKYVTTLYILLFADCIGRIKHLKINFMLIEISLYVDQGDHKGPMLMLCGNIICCIQDEGFFINFMQSIFLKLLRCVQIC